MLKLVLADALRMKGEMMQSLLDQLWEMDKEESYARLTITPIATKNGKVYQWQEEIQIRPYPNPMSYGGQWGSGFAKDKQELDRLTLGFKAQLERLKAQGLEKIEIKWRPEVSQAEYETQQLKRQLENKHKVSGYGKQLSIF